MLRIVVLLLLLANGLYFVWAQGFMRAYGLAPNEQREPQRLAEQIRPQAWRILSAEELRRVETAARLPPKPTECLQAGLFDPERATALRQTLERTLPLGTWALQEVNEPARWIIYMGKYANAEAAKKKRAELASLNLNFEPLGDAKLEPGLSLGSFESATDANTELKDLLQRGVKTAKVVQVREAVRGSVLRLAAVDEVLRARLDDIKAELADKPLKACP